MTERSTSVMMITRAVGTEVKVQSLLVAKRSVGRIRRRVVTAARQALCGVVVVCVRSLALG